jgi:hypothetical protein
MRSPMVLKRASRVVATSTEEHFDDTLPAGVNRTRFYRLRLVP